MKKVEISKTVKSTVLTKREITKIVNFVFQKEKIKNYSVSILFVGDIEMKSLHTKYLNKNSTTDVLTFVLNDNPLETEFCLNVEEAKRQAEIYKVSLKNEIARLIIHCALHSIGFDDITEKLKNKMFAVQEKYLKNILKN